LKRCRICPNDGAKRPKGKVSIPIVAQLKTLLDRHRAECGNPIRGFVFANASGNAMNLEALARDVIRPAIKESGLEWHGRHAFRRGLPTNLHRLGISDNVIQQILRHANVTTTMDIYVKTVSSDAAAAMKTLQTTCATTVQPLPLASTRVIRNAIRLSNAGDKGYNCKDFRNFILPSSPASCVLRGDSAFQIGNLSVR
jgi:hypothetical protein